MSVQTYKSFNILLAESMTDLAAQTQITQMGPGSKARALLEIINARLAAAYQYIDQRLANSLLASAQGDFLDYLGDILACPRYGATYASAAESVSFYVANGTFGDINNGNAILIPAGTTVSTGAATGDQTGTISYQVAQDTTLPANASLWYVPVVANLPGIIGAVGAGAITWHNLAARAGLLVKNVDAIANGTNIETDEAYRFRLSKQVTAAAKANETSVRLACLSIPGVANVLLKPYANGGGTFEVYVISTNGNTSDALLRMVQTVINSQQAFGITGIARAPQRVGVQFQALVYPTKVLNDVESSVIEEYLNQAAVQHFSSYVIGQDFMVNNLLADLIKGSSFIKTIGLPNKPFSQLFVWKPSVTGNGRRRLTLTGNYTAKFNEIVQLEVQDGLNAADFRMVA